MMKELQRLYTVEEVAKYFNVSEQSIFSWIKQGELPAIVFKKTIGIRWEDLQEFIMRHRTAQ
jgi:excisionase family DNA binding protein